MGTCVSKCCFNPSPNLPQDKLVISQSPPPPPPLPLPQPTHSCSSSSSSSSSTTSSSSFPNTSSTPSYSSSSPSLSSSKAKPYSNDFLLARAKENPHIIILDPHKFNGLKPRPRNSPLENVKPPVRPILQHQNQPVTSRCKRERSASPTPPIVRQKSLRREHMPTPAPPSRSSRSQDRRRDGESNHVKLQSLSQCNSLSRQSLGSGKCQENCSKHNKSSTLAENIDNPLISMECFIFL